MEGIYNKENLFAEFAMQKTNEQKVKFLQDMKQLKKDQPHLFRGTSITQKNFDNLIVEWSKDKPWYEINQDIKRSNKLRNSVDGEEVSL
jgi:hypothetical protein|tara:strand:+ start:207 stop:473 length:267 start_codon:yes stop_codon:yes gene_type:complete